MNISPCPGAIWSLKRYPTYVPCLQDTGTWLCGNVTD